MALSLPEITDGLVDPKRVSSGLLGVLGVRQMRSTYLVDNLPEGRRSVNAVVTNTAIGLILLAVGAVGGALTLLGPQVALAGFAVMSLLGGLWALCRCVPLYAIVDVTG